MPSSWFDSRSGRADKRNPAPIRRDSEVGGVFLAAHGVHSQVLYKNPPLPRVTFSLAIGDESVQVVR